MKSWWKILTIVLLSYTVVAGLLAPVPRQPILHETIRNLYFHVTMWFGMFILLFVSLVYGIKYLSTNNLRNDILAEQAAKVGILFGVLGLMTGSLWAKYTWGAWWVNDPKLNAAAATMLIYFAYLLLRSSIDDEEKRAKIASVYSIFAYMMMMGLVVVMPRLTDSLQPGNGGNPGFSKYDLDNNMRMVFYPAIIGWSLLGVWIMTIMVQMKQIEYSIDNQEI